MERLKLREMVITFEVLSFCRIQEIMCAEKKVGELFVRDQSEADQSAEASHQEIMMV